MRGPGPGPGPRPQDKAPESTRRYAPVGAEKSVEDAADGGGAPEALTRENLGTIERGTAEQPALRGLRDPRVPMPLERYCPFSFLGAELPGTGTGAFILPS